MTPAKSPVCSSASKDEQASAQVLADLLEVGGQVAKDRYGDLAVGGASAWESRSDWRLSRGKKCGIITIRVGWSRLARRYRGG